MNFIGKYHTTVLTPVALMAGLFLFHLAGCSQVADFPIVNPCDPLYQGPESCDFYGSDARDVGEPDLTGDAGPNTDIGGPDAPDTAVDSGLEEICQGSDGTILTGWCFIDGECHQAGSPNGVNMCLVCAPDTNPTLWSQAAQDLPCITEDGEESTCQDGVCLPPEECLCDTPSLCCDGCHPINTGTECFFDNLPCSSWLCGEGGDCEQVIVEGWCLDRNNTCRDLSKDPNHCGTCHQACPAEQVCVNGLCQQDCGDTMELCGQGCVDVLTDPLHCGGCDQPCLEGRDCENGVCSTTCSSGLTMCGDTLCVNLDSDLNHCGECFNRCNPGQPCRDGQCVKYATGVSIVPAATTIGLGQTITLEALFEPEDTTDQRVTWFSLNPQTISVTPNDGEVTGLAVGTGQIRVTTVDGNHTAFATIEVSRKVAGVTLDQTDVQLNIGAQITLTATITPANAENKQVAWSTSQSSVAEVDDQGTVTARTIGSATITVTTMDGGYTAQCAVTVSDVQVTGVSLTPTSLTMERGSRDSLRAALIPPHATTRTMFWTSSNNGVVTVDQGGNLFAVEAGEATITVRTQDGGHTDTCLVTVIVSATELAVTPTTMHIPILGTRDQITPLFTPPDTTDQMVTWISHAPEIATVDGDGMVTSVSLGETTVTATARDGGYTAQTEIISGIRVTGVGLSPADMIMAPATTGQFNVAFEPPDATIQTVTWASNDPATAEVNPTTGLITAKTVGTATITATTTDGNYTAASTVQVAIRVTQLEVIPSALTMAPGETHLCTPIISPPEATIKTVVWESNNPDVAMVDRDTGAVTGIIPGTATITATTEDGGFTSTCQVTVIIPLLNIRVEPASITLEPGGHTYQLAVAYTPPDATNQTVSWASSNTSTVNVTQGGLLTSGQPGSATITATSLEGGFTSNCTVQVNTPVTGVTVSPPTLSMHRGTATHISHTIQPANATNQGVTWSSDNTNVATVTNDGYVVAQNPGRTYVKVTTNDGSKTASCRVDVYMDVNFQSSSGGFTPYMYRGDWEYGIPSTGPGTGGAYGSRLWGTKLTTNYSAQTTSWLDSPNIVLSSSYQTVLQFTHWHNYSGANTAALYVCNPYNHCEKFGTVIAESSAQWRTTTVAIPNLIEGTAHISFMFDSGDLSGADGWFIRNVFIGPYP